MNDMLEARIVAELYNHRGAANGIKSPALAMICGTDERTVRDLIGHLIEEHRRPIGSHPDRGYFLVETVADRELATRHLKSRALKLFKRLSALEKIPLDELAKQLKFWEEI